MKVPFYSFQAQNALKKDIMKAMEQVFDSGRYILDESVEAFEKEYAAFNQVAHCIGVGNGLDALQISLKALGIQQGDEVLVPANTFMASWLAISALGAIPKPVEPDPATYNIDPDQIKDCLSSKTKAIMPVHLYGQACKMEAIMDIASEHKLYVVEDNAQAQGATYMGRLTGSFGHINATSFYPTKNLGAMGDAGAITTGNEYLATNALMLRNYGSDRKYHYQVQGQNSRLDELQAAILRIKLPQLLTWNQERINAAACYHHHLQGVGDLLLPEVADHATHVYHVFVIRTKHRDALQSYLFSKEIETLIHYPIPPHLQKANRFLAYKKGQFSITEALAVTSLSLPIYPGLQEKQVMQVCKAIKQYFGSSLRNQVKNST